MVDYVAECPCGRTDTFEIPDQDHDENDPFYEVTCRSCRNPVHAQSLEDWRLGGDS